MGLPHPIPPEAKGQDVGETECKEINYVMNTLWATLSCHIRHMPSESSSNLTRLQGPREGLLGKAARATPSGNALFISSRAKERKDSRPRASKLEGPESQD